MDNSAFNHNGGCGGSNVPNSLVTQMQGMRMQEEDRGAQQQLQQQPQPQQACFYPGMEIGDALGLFVRFLRLQNGLGGLNESGLMVQESNPVIKQTWNNRVWPLFLDDIDNLVQTHPSHQLSYLSNTVARYKDIVNDALRTAPQQSLVVSNAASPMPTGRPLSNFERLRAMTAATEAKDKERALEGLALAQFNRKTAGQLVANQVVAAINADSAADIATAAQRTKETAHKRDVDDRKLQGALDKLERADDPNQYHEPARKKARPAATSGTKPGVAGNGGVRVKIVEVSDDDEDEEDAPPLEHPRKRKRNY